MLFNSACCVYSIALICVHQWLSGNHRLETDTDWVCWIVASSIESSGGLCKHGLYIEYYKPRGINQMSSNTVYLMVCTQKQDSHIMCECIFMMFRLWQTFSEWLSTCYVSLCLLILTWMVLLLTRWLTEGSLTLPPSQLYQNLNIAESLRPNVQVAGSNCCFCRCMQKLIWP